MNRLSTLFVWGLPILVQVGLRFAHAEKDLSSWRKYSQGELISETTGLAPGATGTVGLRVRLAEKWHTYWLNPGDSGAALRLEFRNSPGVNVNRVLMPYPKRLESGPLISFGYEREVLFPIEVRLDESLTPGTKAHFEIDAEWLVCEDVCIPAYDTFKIDVPIVPLAEIRPTDHFAAFQRARGQIPSAVDDPPRFTVGGDTVDLTIVNFPKGRDFVDFFPFKNSGATNEAPVVAESGGTVKLSFHKGAVAQAATDRTGVLVTRQRNNGQIEAWQYGESGWAFTEAHRHRDTAQLMWMLLFAFVGGVILNLMPCVFPVLSIKLLSLLKLSEGHPGEVRRNNLAYVAGVMVSFLLIGAALSAMRSAGQMVGWGFQLQSPVFLAALCWLFFLMSLNLLGVFEIDFLNAGLGHSLTRFGGAWGSFFTGVLAVVVASPCTAPFMGVALGFGLSQSVPVLVGIFLSLGLGLASPYLLFAVFPSWIRVLPKPGLWMVRFKQLLAFPLLLTLVWMSWVLEGVVGGPGVVVVLGGCMALGLALWLSSGGRRLAAVLAATVPLMAGLTYISLAGRDDGVAAAAQALKDEDWRPFSLSLLESLRSRETPVFVDMTADWCLSCKVNERLVLGRPEILALMKSKGIELVKGDWTRRNEEITSFLNRYNRVGVPFYVLYSPGHPEGLILPEVLTESMFREVIAREFP